MTDDETQAPAMAGSDDSPLVTAATFGHGKPDRMPMTDEQAEILERLSGHAPDRRLTEAEAGHRIARFEPD